MADKAGKRKAKAKREKASVLGNLPATRPQRLGRPRADAPTAAVDEPAPPPRPKHESPRRPQAGPARVEATPAGRSRPAKPATASGRAAKPAAKAPAAGRGAAKPAASAKPPAARQATAPAGRRAKPAAAAKPPATPSKPAVEPSAAARDGRTSRAAKSAKDGATSRAAKAAKPVAAKRAAAKPAAAAKKPGTPRRPAAVRPGARALGQQRRVGDPPPVRTVQPPRGTELVTTTIQAVGELAQIGLTVGGRALKRAVDRLPKP
jgi:hypothetical protein